VTDTTRLVIKWFAAVAGLVLGAYLVWGLRTLLVPAAVGGLLAYICRPLVTWLERWRVSRGVAIGVLLLVFVLAAVVLVDGIRAAIPTDTGMLELRVRALYTLNQRYQALMELDPSLTRGNRIYQLVHADLDPLVDRMNQLLALAPDEQAEFFASRRRGVDQPTARPDRLVDYHRANVQMLETHARRTASTDRAARSVEGAPPTAPAPTSLARTPLTTLGELLSTWVIAPLVFLFLLRDNGEIKRGLLRVVPNRLFEPALTVLADLDRALGAYLRGIFLECCLLGLSVLVLLVIIGIPLRWAIVIGSVAGASNVIPYMGFAMALASGLAYAVLADEVHPLLPMVSIENFPLWVVGAVAFSELLKNVVYEPVILGSAVSIHPLVVVIGILGGAILFGPVGMLLAIPTITVVKVFVSSTARQLKAYGLF
jgi:predicted PurR-regulated permease PerM